MRIYAIGDIHGQLGMLTQAHARIAADRRRTGDASAPVVHLGDLVDRGPDSRAVIQYLIDGIERGEPWIVLKGNHDQMFADLLADIPSPRASFASWLSASIGGDATLASYGVDRGAFSLPRKRHRALQQAVPDDHKTFLNRLLPYYESPDLLFVHAGIRPGLPLSEQIEEDLLWIRRDFLDDERDHGRLIIHGHTPVSAPVHCGNRVNLDTGAGYDRVLTAAVFERREAWILDEAHRIPLPAP